MEKTKALVPLADGFEEIEAVTIIDVLRRAGIETVTAALAPDNLIINGAHGISIVADTTFSEGEASPPSLFNAIILPGGMKAMESFRADKRIISLIQFFHAQNKIVAAVCASPVVLATAGILEGRRVVCHPSVISRIPAANHQPDTTVLRDGNIITATGAGTSMAFALEIVSALTSPATAADIAAKMQFKQ